VTTTVSTPAINRTADMPRATNQSSVTWKTTELV